jgi:hypothetical protein
MRDVANRAVDVTTRGGAGSSRSSLGGDDEIDDLAVGLQRPSRVCEIGRTLGRNRACCEQGRGGETEGDMAQ